MRPGSGNGSYCGDAGLSGAHVSVQKRRHAWDPILSKRFVGGGSSAAEAACLAGAHEDRQIIEGVDLLGHHRNVQRLRIGHCQGRDRVRGIENGPPLKDRGNELANERLVLYERSQRRLFLILEPQLRKGVRTLYALPLDCSCPVGPVLRSHIDLSLRLRHLWS